MDAHDPSLKYLLAQDPAGFLSFGLACPTLKVLRPVEGDLPHRDRDVDGGYLVEREGALQVAHVEFYRMHRSLAEVALDIGDAQLRLFRREQVPVCSLLWDLYGSRKAQVLEERSFPVGAEGDAACTRIAYRRVNLRGMGADELLERGPRGLYALVPLTRDGASPEGVRRAMQAIEGRTDLSGAQRADHLAVLWFLGEAEGLPVEVMKAYISERNMMQSELYRSIFSKGEARGEARGKARGKAEGKADDLLRIFLRRRGPVDEAVRQRIQAETRIEVLDMWIDDALLARDEASFVRLLEQIQKTPPPAQE